MSEETAVVKSEQISIPAIIDKLSQTPALSLESIGVLERLVALQERRDEQERRERFFGALARVQAIMPRVLQNGLMVRVSASGKDGGSIPYAKREDIDTVIRPLYIKEGFSVTWDAPTSDETGNIHVVGRFTCHGHSESREWVCKPDPSGGKTGPQAVSSTIAYGKRQIEKMFWNIIEEGVDKNGSRAEDVTAISQAQADTLRSVLDSFKNPHAAHARFLEMYGIKKIEDLRVSQLDDAHKRLESARNK